MIGQELVNVMLQDGVEISTEERVKVACDLEKEVTEGRVRIIQPKDVPIGFMTYIEDKGRLFIDYLFIFKVFRNRFTLVHLRKIFRKHYGKFAWKSRKRNHYFCAG